jgi:hypothetical protein
MAMAWNGQSWAGARGSYYVETGTAYSDTAYHLPTFGAMLGTGSVPSVVVYGERSGLTGIIQCPCRGDVNLDGAMTLADRAIISGHIPMGGAGWTDGDLNGNGSVSADDLSLVCTADFNCDGAVGTPDVLEYLAAWFQNEPRADYNGMGGVGVQDIFDFLNGWFAGC